MQFSTVIASFLAASVAVANPIARDNAARDLCDNNCFIGQEVTNAENAINSAEGYVQNAVSILVNGPVAQTVDALNSAESDIVTFYNELAADINTLDSTVQAEVAAQVQAAIKAGLSDISTNLATIEAAAGQAATAAASVASAISTLATYLTACVNGN